MAMVGHFVEVHRRRGLKVNAGKSKVTVLNGEEKLEYEVHVDEICLEHVTEFIYFGCFLDESGTKGGECSRKVVSVRRVAGDIRSLANIKGLQLECSRSCMSDYLCLFLRMVVRQ